MNFLLKPLHALDATLWTFFLELYTLLMLRCKLSSQNFTRSWCYVVNLLRTLHAFDATLWTFLPRTVFTAFCFVLAVPMFCFSSFFSLFLVFLFLCFFWGGFFRQSVLPLNPQGFMSQLRRLLKSNWAPMEKVKGAHGWSPLALHTEHGVIKRWWWWWWWRGWRRWWRWWRWCTKDEWTP